MPHTLLPLEVELLYETMPCNAMRVAQEPKTTAPHACAYFRQWGTYHSFDYVIDGPQPKPGIPTRDEIRDALSGNYCRCTGYEAIVDAIENVARDRGAASFAQTREGAGV